MKQESKSGTVYLDWKPIPLEDFIKQNRDIIAGQRLFYVLKANSDNRIYKVGVSHPANGRHHSRLDDYIRYHGLNLNDNKCSGVILHYIRGWKYQEGVAKKDTHANRLEKMVKRLLKHYNLQKVGRKSDERFDIKMTTLKGAVNETIPEAVLTAKPLTTRAKAKEESYLKNFNTFGKTMNGLLDIV